MRLRSSLLFAVFSMALLAGCDDDPTEPAGLTLDDLVGSWTASSVLYTNNANAAEVFDIVAAGGEVRTTVLDGGGARTWVTLGDFSDEWDAQLSLSGNTLTSTPAEAARGVRVFTIVLDGNTLTMTRADAMWDFTLMAGEGVSATEVTVFVRQ